MSGLAVLWRRIDLPGHDACRLDETEDGWLLHGTAVYLLEGTPVRLDYRVTCDRAWLTRDAAVRGWVGTEPIEHVIARMADGHWLLDGAPVPGLEDCVDVDFGFTPATNVLQLRRVALATGEDAIVSVAWLDVPVGTLSRLDQHYRRATEGTYDYDSPRFSYRAVLEIDAHGFATKYPDLWEMER